MRRSRATSLFQLALLAVVAVLVPPSAALLTAAVSVEQLASTGDQTVLVAVRTVDLSHALVEHVTAMERFARQRRVLGDGSDLREPYLSRRAELVGVIDELAALPLSDALHERLDTLVRVERELHTRLLQPPESAAYGAALEGFAGLSESCRALRREASVAMGTAASQLEADARGLQQRLLRQGLWVVPVVTGFAVAGWLGIGRPLRSLDEAIRQLGSGRLEAAIEVSGPGDLQALGERLEWLRQQLLAVESDRVRLFNHVSHELKTPLTCIREGAQLLADGVTGPLSAEQQEIAGILSTNAARLQQQIEDLLRISELRTRGPSLERSDVDLGDIVGHVVAQYAVAARAAGIPLEVRVERIQVYADAHKLRTVIDNLLGNALKHGPRGRPVKIEVRREGDHVELAVEDEGPGIPADEREALFEAFKQGRSAWLGATRGTGLGLTIAREYMRAHGGDLVIRDGLVGARVVASLPLAAEGA